MVLRPASSGNTCFPQMLVLPGFTKPAPFSASQLLSNSTPFVSLAKSLVPGSITITSMPAVFLHVSRIPSSLPIVFRVSFLPPNLLLTSRLPFLIVGALPPPPYLALSLGFSLFSALSSLLRVAWSQGIVTVVGFFSFLFPSPFPLGGISAFSVFPV